MAPDWVLKAFYKADYLFVKSSYDEDLADSFIGPILELDRYNCPKIRWKADEKFCPKVINSHGTKAEKAILWLQKFLKNYEPITYAARKGETLLIPNCYMLHGRTALSSNSPREVLRVWIK